MFADIKTMAFNLWTSICKHQLLLSRRCHPIKLWPHAHQPHLQTCQVLTKVHSIRLSTVFTRKRAAANNGTNKTENTSSLSPLFPPAMQ